MTKRDRQIVEAYKDSTKWNLWFAYKSFSKAKDRAWDYCEYLCKEMNGKDLKVISANTSFFTAGFLFYEDGQEKLMYITKSDNRAIAL